MQGKSLKFQSFPDFAAEKIRNFFVPDDALRLPNAVKKLYTILVKKRKTHDGPKERGTHGFSSEKSMK